MYMLRSWLYDNYSCTMTRCDNCLLDDTKLLVNKDIDSDWHYIAISQIWPSLLIIPYAVDG